MYYYIMESAVKKTIAWQDKVKDILGDLGIAGETVSPSSARTVEELTSLGIAKGYTTIVAVGDEALADKVASAIIASQNQDIVMGYVAYDFTTELAQKIGATDVKQACETLKFRKLATFDTVLIEPNQYFLTTAYISSKKPQDAYISCDTIQAGLIFNQISVTSGLTIDIKDDSENSSGGLLAKLFGSTKKADIYSSHIVSQTLKVETIDQSTPVVIENQVIAKTPISFKNVPKALKIIVARDMITPKSS